MEAQGGAQLTREEKVAVVEVYLKGLVSKDISKVPFATDITFEGPRVPPLAGREVVVGFLKIFFRQLKISKLSSTSSKETTSPLFLTWRRPMESIASSIAYVCSTVK
jgi:hypothetical protein